MIEVVDGRRRSGTLNKVIGGWISGQSDTFPSMEALAMANYIPSQSLGARTGRAL